MKNGKLHDKSDGCHCLLHVNHSVHDSCLGWDCELHIKVAPNGVPISTTVSGGFLGILNPFNKKVNMCG